MPIARASPSRQTARTRRGSPARAAATTAARREPRRARASAGPAASASKQPTSRVARLPVAASRHPAGRARHPVGAADHPAVRTGSPRRCRCRRPGTRRRAAPRAAPSQLLAEHVAASVAVDRERRTSRRRARPAARLVPAPEVRRPGAPSRVVDAGHDRARRRRGPTRRARRERSASPAQLPSAAHASGRPSSCDGRSARASSVPSASTSARAVLVPPKSMPSVRMVPARPGDSIPDGRTRAPWPA